MSENEEQLQEFVDNIRWMNSLYNAGRYTKAEQVRDELAERLDDIMRLDEFDYNSSL